MTTARRVATIAQRAGQSEPGSRAVPVESPVALVVNGGTVAVMMATPADLEDFALGFALTEGLLARGAAAGEVEVLAHSNGYEARQWLAATTAEQLAERRRLLAGPTGCGLCGIDSLDGALRPPPPVGSGRRLAPATIRAALAALAPAQTLNLETRAVHAAAFFVPGEGLVALREDVGRHNALDKLAGALARAGRPAEDGIVLLTSRVSVEMVQKAAAIGAPVLVAISAPTTLAIDTALRAGITLIGVARPDGFEIFTHPERIETEARSHVA